MDLFVTAYNKQLLIAPDLMIGCLCDRCSIYRLDRDGVYFPFGVFYCPDGGEDRQGDLPNSSVSVCGSASRASPVDCLEISNAAG